MKIKLGGKEIAGIIISITLLSSILTLPMAKAVNINLQPTTADNNSVVDWPTETILECDVTLDIATGEDIPTNSYISIVVDDSEVASYTLLGTPRGDTVKKFELSSFTFNSQTYNVNPYSYALLATNPYSYSNAYGIVYAFNTLYGYAFMPYSFAPGYGYGYAEGFMGPATFNYDCEIDTSDLSPGNHNIKAELVIPDASPNNKFTMPLQTFSINVPAVIQGFDVIKPLPASPNTPTPINGTITIGSTNIDIELNVKTSKSVTVGLEPVDRNQLTNFGAQLPSNFKDIDIFVRIEFDDPNAIIFPLELCMTYPDSDNNGIVDGTNIQETELIIAKQKSNEWIEGTNTTIDPNNNKVCAEFNDLSVFALVKSEAQQAAAAPTPGGGGGGGTVISMQIVASQFALLKGTNNVIDVGREILYLDKLTIILKKGLEVPISIALLKDKPTNIPDAPGKVLAYYSVTIPNIVNENIDKASIEFKIDKDTISRQNIDPDIVRLYRFDEFNKEWQLIKVEKVGEDADFVYYKAEVNKFSILALTADRLIKPVTEFKPILKEEITRFPSKISIEDQRVDDKIIGEPRLLYGRLLTDNIDADIIVKAPNGDCIIGQDEDCLIKDNTANERSDIKRTLKKVTLSDGTILYVRYSGPDSKYERFTIITIGKLPLGDWVIDVSGKGELIYTIKYKEVR